MQLKCVARSFISLLRCDSPAWETSRVRNSARTSCGTLSRSIARRLHRTAIVRAPHCAIDSWKSSYGVHRYLFLFVVLCSRNTLSDVLEDFGRVRTWNQERLKSSGLECGPRTGRGWNVYWSEKFRNESWKEREGESKFGRISSEVRERILKLSFLSPTASWCFFFVFFYWGDLLFVALIYNRNFSCNLFFL